MTAYEDFGPNRVKHLEMIQAIVSRLGGNGFLIKGWALTIAGVFIGLAVNDQNCSFALVGAGASAVLWGLDGYFLQAERSFRELGDRVRKLDPDVPPFFMGATGKQFRSNLAEQKRRELSWLGATLSWTLLAFYGLLVLVPIVVSFSL